MKNSEVRFERQPIVLEPLPSPRVEIINLIDVLITLVAFFLMTTVFAETDHRLGLELPKAKHAESSRLSQKPKILLEIDRFERLSVDGIEMNWDDLEKVFAKADPDTVVVIRADRNTDYQKVITVLDCLKQYQLAKLSFEVASGEK